MRYAIRNLIRLKSRSILTFLLALLILFLSMFGVLIIRICEDSRESFWGPLDGSIHVTDEHLSPFLNYNTAAFIEEHADVVTKISAIWEASGYIRGLEHLGTGENMREVEHSEQYYLPQGETMIDYFKGFTVCGVTSMEILGEVTSGELTMVEGTMITEENNASHAYKIVISKTVAEQNGLCLGDMIELDSLSLYLEDSEARTQYFGLGGEGKHYESVPYIIGGFYEHQVDNSVSATSPDQIHENKVYVPISTLSDLSELPKLQEFYQIYYMNPKEFLKLDVIPDRLYFHMDDIGDAPLLEEALNSLGFAKTIKLTPYMSDATSSPSARLSEIVTILLFGVIAFGFIVLVLAVVFHMKARHRELAVLAALGQKRGVITCSFFAEIAVLMLLALICGFGLLSVMVVLFAEPIGTYLVASEYTASITSENADRYLIENAVQNIVTEKMADNSYLFMQYTLPSFLFSVVASMGLLLGILIVVYRYVRGINALSGVGGKE